jgi:two-component system NarL family response regulator
VTIQVNNLVLVDDHILFREGMKELISHWDDFEVVGEAANGLEALELCRELLPDVVLMDVSMAVMSGVEAASRIHQELPSVRVVMLTMSEDAKDLFEAIKGGAQGYVLKNTPARRLHDLLRGVMLGESPLSGAIAAKMLTEFTGQESQDSVPLAARVEPLTDREIKILELVAEGLSNAEIGEQLFLGEQTIKKHLHHVLQKLHLNNRVQAAVYAIRQGLIE